MTTTELAKLLDRAVKILEAVRPLYGNEYDLQADLADALQIGGITAVREHRLDDHDRLDLWIPQGETGIAVEVKIKGTRGHVAQQLRRYLAHDQVAAVILVTTVAQHTRIPLMIRNPKPVTVVNYLLQGI